MTVIRQKKTEIHQSVTNRISHELQTILPADRFSIFKDTTISGDLPDPDIQVVYQQHEPFYDNYPVLAVEVGFSQSTEDLEETVKDLIRTQTVPVALMVDIKETPKFKNPLRTKESIDQFKSVWNHEPNNDGNNLKNTKLPDTSMLYLYRFKWAGTLTASVQAFARDPGDGSPINKTKTISFYGKPEFQEYHNSKGNEKREVPIYQSYPKLNIKLSDFVPLQGECYQKEFTLDWDVLRRRLSLHRGFLAFTRYHTAIKKLKKNGLL